MIGRARWPSVQRTGMQARRAYERGLDLVNLYRGHPGVFFQALPEFQATQSAAYAYAGIAFTLVIASSYDGDDIHQHGFEDAVAVLGTALGDQHIRNLKRFVDRIILVLDGDEAGQRRANEVLELFVAEKADLRIVTLPEGLDPADFLFEHGAEAFADLISTRAVDALEHAFQAFTRGLDKT